MKTIFLMLACVSASLWVGQAQADILFCDYNGVSANLGIQDVQGSTSGNIMQASWFYNGTTPIDMALDKIYSYAANDNAIKVNFVTHWTANERVKFEIALDLKGKVVTQQFPSTWPPFYNGAPRQYFSKPVKKYVGTIAVRGPQRSYSGPAVCEWQYRNTL